MAPYRDLTLFSFDFKRTDFAINKTSGPSYVHKSFARRLSFVLTIALPDSLLQRQVKATVAEMLFSAHGQSNGQTLLGVNCRKVEI